MATLIGIKNIKLLYNILFRTYIMTINGHCIVYNILQLTKIYIRNILLSNSINSGLLPVYFVNKYLIFLPCIQTLLQL